MNGMKRKAVGLLFGALVVASTAGPALADTTGYEGQPGNQSSSVQPGQPGDGPQGYEGQPGNQAGQPGEGGSPAPGLLGYEGQPGNQGG
jgi:hypothetical protein